MDKTTKFLVELGSNAVLRNRFKENPEKILFNYQLSEEKVFESTTTDSDGNYKLGILTPNSNHKLMIATPASDCSHKLSIATP